VANGSPTAKGGKQMKIVSVCACTVGIARTFMAKTAIEEEAKKRGWSCKVDAKPAAREDALAAVEAAK